MKKIKKIFVTNNNDQQEQKKQNKKQKNVKTESIDENPDENSRQQHNNSYEECVHCKENAYLIQRYEVLIKLFKIKIIKLEKRLNLKSQPNNPEKIDQFQDFTMDLDTASLQTLKNTTQRNLSPFKVIKFDPNISADENQKSFDKTVLKVEKTGQVKSAKHLKNILNDFKNFQQDIENELCHQSKTSKSIKQRLNQAFQSEKINDQLGKQISFIKLMQKSEFSINTSKNITFQQFSTIKRSGSIEKYSTLDFQSPNTKINKIKQENQQQRKLRLFSDRIQFLTQTIIDLKSFLMHVRHSVFQFIKMTDISRLRKHEPSSYEMLRIIMRIFEFSEDEMQEMIVKKSRKRQESKIHNFFFSTLVR